MDAARHWHPGIPPEFRNQVVTGDARELAERLPDASVDLIFCDPVYDRLEDYYWLGRTASRLLKPGGSLLAWSNGRWHRPNANALEQAGLTYRWEFAYVITTGAAPMNGKIIAKTNRLLWFDLGRQSRMEGYLADGYAGVAWSRPHSHNHRWTKSPKFTAQALLAFSSLDATVFDPFTGGGTVPAICRQFGRNFVAFEWDPETATLARERVRLTPIPLLLPEPEPPLRLPFEVPA